MSASKKFNSHIPLCAQFCFKHSKLETKEGSIETINSPNPQATVPKESRPSDEMFVPEDISVSEDVLETASVSETNLTCTLGRSPIQYYKKKGVRIGRINKTKTEKSLKEHRNN